MGEGKGHSRQTRIWQDRATISYLMPRHSSQRKLGVGNTAGAANAPAFFGRVDNTVEALHLVRAAQLDVVPRIRQRLNSEEREAMVISGAVFVFNVNEASMKRWTDGKIWSPSRIDGNFLVSANWVSMRV